MFPSLGPLEMIVVMGIAVMLFGKRLPEVGRSLGKGIVEFKKGLRGIEEGFDFSGESPSRHAAEDRPRTASASAANDLAGNAVPKFEPPTTAPVPQMEYQPPAGA